MTDSNVARGRIETYFQGLFQSPIRPCDSSWLYSQISVFTISKNRIPWKYGGISTSNLSEQNAPWEANSRSAI